VTRTSSALVLSVLMAGCRSNPPGAESPSGGSQPLWPSRTTSATAAVTASAAPSVPVPVPEVSARPALLAGGGVRAVSGQRGVVTSAEDHATRAGVELLEAGGNAMDAAVATAAALAVTHPSAGNLGGGGFLLARPAGGPSVALDFRETAPASLSRPDFDRMIAERGRGPVAVGVPGSVAGLLSAHRRFGKLSLARVLEPSIRLARGGFSLSKPQAAALAKSWPALRLDPAARRVFAGKPGQALSAGAKLVQSDLAATLERIATLGEAGFYAGATAQAISTATGKRVTLAELSAYRAIFREPLRLPYRGLSVETMPLPSTGGLVMLGELGALARLGASELPAESAAEAHRFVEVSKRAQAVRRLSLLDPDTLTEEERRKRELSLLDPGALLAVPFDAARATPASSIHPLYREALRETDHTTHLSVADATGMVVSLTTTLSASFGAKVMAPGTGVLLGNAVASFGSVGDNQPVPGRRTTSSMAPTLVLSGDSPVLVLGTPGGDTIPSTLTLIVRRLVDRGRPLDEAIEAPRFHHGFVPDTVRTEAARPLGKSVEAELRALGHRLAPSHAVQGDANCLLIQGGVTFGYADTRDGDGLALAATR
jgi:gamma-glutamyltranspeptidase/glutathione hydrolase